MVPSRSSTDADIAILGGGPAGSVLAIRLRLAGFAVAVIEKTSGPTNKLCGEFLSPEVDRVFAELGLAEAIADAGAVRIRQLRMTSVSGGEFVVRLPDEATGLSRAVLDELLLARAAELGVFVIRGHRISGVAGSFDAGFQIAIEGRPPLIARYAVGAYGKSSNLDRAFLRPHLGRTSPWVAFKSHYEGASTQEAVELHLLHRGYCGLSMVEGDRMNACWIMHADDLKSYGGRPESFASSYFSSNPRLRDRMSGARPVFDRYVSASQLSFRARGTCAGDLLLVGDAAGMIAPLCGDGMAMAIDSAGVAAPLINQLLSGETSLDSAKADYTRNWRTAFARRLWLGRAVQSAILNERGGELVVGMGHRFPALASLLIRTTRGHVNASLPWSADP